MTRTGTYAKGVVKRREVLEAAMKVLVRDGYKASLRAIAKESGLSLTGLMHYFPTRDELMLAVLRDIDDHVAEELFEAGAAFRPGDYLADVMALNASEPARAHLYVGMLAEAANPAHPAAEYMRERYAMGVRVLAEWIRDRQAEGQLASTLDPEFTASALFAAADGIQVQWLQDRSIDMAAHVRRMWALLTQCPS